MNPFVTALFTSPEVILATWDLANKNANVTLSNANRTATAAASAVDYPAHGLPQKSGGSYYFEVTIGAVGGGLSIGVCAPAASLADGEFAGATANGGGYSNSGNYLNNGGVYANVASFTTGNVIGVYYKATTGELWWSKNGVVQAGNPIAGTGGMPGITTTGVPCVSVNASAAVTITQPISIPSGYTLWGA